MPEELVGGSTMTFARSWAASLTSELKNGAYKDEKSSWLSGMSLDDPVATSMGWARDANSYVCTAVIPRGVDAVEGKELDGQYYRDAVPVIEVQIAKGT